jgi:hypothetical protein
VSETTNSHKIEADLEGTTWSDLCTLSPVMASRAQVWVLFCSSFVLLVAVVSNDADTCFLFKRNFFFL